MSDEMKALHAEIERLTRLWDMQRLATSGAQNLCASEQRERELAEQAMELVATERDDLKRQLVEARSEAEKYFANIEERQAELKALVDAMVVRCEQLETTKTALAEAQAHALELRGALKVLYAEADQPRIYTLDDNGQRCAPYTSLPETTRRMVRAALAREPSAEALRAFGLRVLYRAHPDGSISFHSAVVDAVLRG